jgi:hypothetical protein
MHIYIQTFAFLSKPTVVQWLPAVSLPIIRPTPLLAAGLPFQCSQFPNKFWKMEGSLSPIAQVKGGECGACKVTF